MLTTQTTDWVSTSKAISQHATVPWILLSRGMGFDHFKTLTQITAHNGASGIAVGRAVWQEINQLAKANPDPQTKYLEIKKFLMTTGRQRLQTLTDLVAKYARPWTDFSW